MSWSLSSLQFVGICMARYKVSFDSSFLGIRNFEYTYEYCTPRVQVIILNNIIVLIGYFLRHGDGDRPWRRGGRSTRRSFPGAIVSSRASETCAHPARRLPRQIPPSSTTSCPSEYPIRSPFVLLHKRSPN